MLKNREFSGSLDLGPGPPQPRDGRHVEAGDDAHQRVEVGQVDALASHLDPELYHLHTHLLLLFLEEVKKRVCRNNKLEDQQQPGAALYLFLSSQK